MKKSNKFLKRFTLVELMVSMGVFLILLTLLLNFFSGTRQVWKTLRERNDAYANARIAMDLMSELISCSVASDQIVGFYIGAKSNGNNSCTFLTSSNRTLEDTDARGGLGLYAVKLHLDEGTGSEPNGFLRVTALPAGKAAGENFNNKAFDKNALDVGTGSGKLVIRSVSGLTFTKLTATAATNSRPMAVEITLKVFDNQDNYLTWRKMPEGDDEEKKAKNKFRSAHEYTFSRVISFDDIEEEL